MGQKYDMVWVISFVVVMNIAMGYGLAVYVDRQFGTLLFAFPNLDRLRQATQASLASAAKGQSVVAGGRTTKASVPQAAVEGAPPLESGGTSKVAAADTTTVDEGKVLAGIEEFRSQLAKMNTRESNSEPAGARATV